MQNLLTTDGIRGIFTSAVNNFTGHASLGSIVVAMLGVGLADETGLLTALIKKIVLSTPKFLVSAIVIFAGVMSNIASHAGYVVLIPLGAVIFASFGRHPLAGIAAAFAGVSGGFSANLLIGTTDPLLGWISTEAAQIVLPGYSVDATANYFFMFASTILITVIGAWITDKVVEPRLGEYTGPKLEIGINSQLNENEKKGLTMALISIIIFIAVLLLMILPENAIFKLNAKEVDEFVSANNRNPELWNY